MKRLPCLALALNLASRLAADEPLVDAPMDLPDKTSQTLEDAITEVATDSFGRLPLGVAVSADFELHGVGSFAKLVGLQAQGTISADRDRLEPSLASYVTFRAAGRVSFLAGLGAETRGLMIDGRLMTGVQAEYEVRMPEERYFEGQFPQPFDPDRMPEGTEIIFEASRHAGTKLEGIFRHIAFELDGLEWDGTAMAVEKIGPRQVRVLTGPIQGVRNNLFLGLALRRFALGVGNSTELKEYSLKTAVFDLDKDSGRGAYFRFLVTGAIGEGEAGMERIATVSKRSFLSETSFRLRIENLFTPLHLDNFVLHKVFAASEGESVVTDYAESGERTEEVNLRYNNGMVGIQSRFQDSQLLERTVHLVVRDVEPAVASYIGHALTGEPLRPEGRQDVQASFTDLEAMALQAAAAGFVARSEWTRPGLIQQLADATHPIGVALALVRAQSPGHMAEDLLRISFESGAPLQGRVRMLPRA